MSANESRSSLSASRIRHAPRAWAQLAFRSASVAGLAAALISACASNGGSSAGNNTEGSSESGTGNTGGNNSGSGNTGNGSNNTGSGSNNTGTGSNNTGSGSNNTGTGGSNTSGSGTSGTSTGGTSSSSTGASGSTSTGGSGASSSSGTSSGSGSTDAGADGSACTNTDMGTINIDSSGFACNNQWGIEGAWYCYKDSSGTSDCGPTGYIPYKASSNAMCMSGTTSTAPASATSYGAGIGLVLSAIGRGIDAGKAQFNATAKNIVGFAVTVSGTTGGAVLNIGFPPPMETQTLESTAVTVPGVSGTSVTYNVMLADAIVSDNNNIVPAPKIVASDITDLQVAIAGGDQIAHTYDYCVTKVVPIMAAPAAPASITQLGPSFNEGKQIVLEGLGGYGIQNDPFNPGGDPMSMTVSYGGGTAGFTASPTFGDTGNTPGAFPSIVSGWVHGGSYVGTAEGGYAGGKSISALTSVKSSWTYTAGGGKWDAAYDCWLAANPAPISAGFELMVWLGHNTVNPIGGQNTPVTVAGAPGMWTVSTGTNGTGNPVVSYVSTSNMTTVTDFDLLPFFKEAASSGRAGLTTGTNLLSVQAGFELYQAGTWTTNSYKIAIQ
jgi:hypothetical protein